MNIPAFIAPAMKNRAISVMIIVMPTVFIILNITGLFVWICPFHHYTGLHCGGCGMTRGVIAAIHGNIVGAFKFHPLSIPLLLLWVLWTITTILPHSARGAVINKIEIIETRTGIVPIVMILFILFGIGRVCVELLK